VFKEVSLAVTCGKPLLRVARSSSPKVLLTQGYTRCLRRVRQKLNEWSLSGT
jgi:hypothetical protein